MASSDVPTALAAGLADEKSGHLPQSPEREFNSLAADEGRGGSTGPEPAEPPVKGQGWEKGENDKSSSSRRPFWSVVPGLPRVKTFKRQQSEVRDKLEAVQPSPDERRAVSVDRRALFSSNVAPRALSNPGTGASESFFSSPDPMHNRTLAASTPGSPLEDGLGELNMVSGPGRFEASLVLSPALAPRPMPEIDTSHDLTYAPDAVSSADARSITTSQYDTMIHAELERLWILNLSMHFRDKSLREKFFVTYREHNTQWRRVTVSLDYRDAPESSLEMELFKTQYQRDKSAKIYEAIRESLMDIQFYDTVTNLKLQTTNGRLHVHVVEDVNEIIHYPTPRMVQHLGCRRVKEQDIEFDTHMSGFVYKVKVNGKVLIKKEIPGPDTVDEFLYEVNALCSLRHASSVIQFHGVVVDDKEEYVKGLLISYAEQGALIDVLYDNEKTLPWDIREKWARQIVQGLSEIHEAGFVQGDFTLSNIVINDEGDAKIIDINRRGCPVGWEPPEATALIESGQRISMYIGVKSDLYQLGMVLWALATQDDEPEHHARPLRLDPAVNVPSWFREIVDVCLSEIPRYRVEAAHLLSQFPESEPNLARRLYAPPSISVCDGYSGRDSYSGHDYFTKPCHPNGDPHIKTVQPQYDWSYDSWSQAYDDAPPDLSDRSYYYPPRGRSPPSPLPSNRGGQDSSQYVYHVNAWSANDEALTAPSISDLVPDEPVDGSQRISSENEQYDISLKSEKDLSAGRDIGIFRRDGSEAGDGQTNDLELSAETIAGDQPRSNGASDVPLPDMESIVHDGVRVTGHRHDVVPQIRKVQEVDQAAPDKQHSNGETAEHVENIDFPDTAETGKTEPELHHGNPSEMVEPSNMHEKGVTGFWDASSEAEPRITTGEAEVPTVESDQPVSGQEPRSTPPTELATEVPNTTTSADPVPEDPRPRSASLRICEQALHLGASQGPESIPDLPNELKGVGLACELFAEPRQEIITEDDLKAEKMDLSALTTSVACGTREAATEPLAVSETGPEPDGAGDANE